MAAANIKMEMMKSNHSCILSMRLKKFILLAAYLISLSFTWMVLIICCSGCSSSTMKQNLSFMYLVFFLFVVFTVSMYSRSVLKTYFCWSYHYSSFSTCFSFGNALFEIVIRDSTNFVSLKT